MNRRISNRLLLGIVITPIIPLLILVVPVAANPPIPNESLSLQELIDLPESDLAMIDIATMNLAAAEGLPGSEHLDRKAILNILDLWASAAALKTLEWSPYFAKNPGEYDNSEAKFNARSLQRTLLLHLGAHYNYKQRTNPNLAKSQDQFINGIIQGTGGTCASLPALYVAVGRRLGYPLRLAQAISHYYVRWDDPVTGEQFNIDVSGDGWSFHSDEHYKKWPRPINPKILDSSNYLKSLSPREELSTFLTTRADCLRENGRLVEAYRTYRKAIELAPRNRFAADLLHETAMTIHKIQVAQKADTIQGRHAKQLRDDPRMMIPGMPAMPTAHAHASRYRPLTNINNAMMQTGPLTNLHNQPYRVDFRKLYTAPPIPSMIPPQRYGVSGIEQLNNIRPYDGSVPMTSMQDYLNKTNRHNESLRRYGQPGINR